MNPIEYASLPAPLWLITSLHILTLTLHLLAMNIVVGGIVIWLFGRFSDRWRHPFVTQLVKLLPTMMAATVTLGVAPLLFVQVVYGRFIYSASIISGWFWLMIFVAAILGYYCLYAAAFSKKGKARTGVYLGSALVCFVYISYVYSSVFALTERPDLQAILYAANQSGLILNNDVGSYLYRWLHVLAGAVTVGGFFVAALGRHNEEAFAAGKLFFLWGMIVASVLGVAYMMSFGEYLLPYMRSTAVWWMLVSVLLSIGSIHLLYKRRFMISGIMLFVSVLGMVVNRHIVRLLHLEGHFDPSMLAVDPQWSALAVFLVSFVLAVVLIVYMLRLYFGGKSKPAAK